MNNVTKLGSGRARKPSALRARQTPATRNEPKPERAQVPAPPTGLNEDERSAWLDLKALVDPLGVFTAADLVAFEAMVTALSTARQAQAVLRREGITFEGIGSREQVVVKARPEVAILLNAQKALMLWMSRFGLSPSDRSRVTQAPEMSEFERARAKRIQEFGG